MTLCLGAMTKQTHAAISASVVFFLSSDVIRMVLNLFSNDGGVLV